VAAKLVRGATSAADAAVIRVRRSRRISPSV